MFNNIPHDETMPHIEVGEEKQKWEILKKQKQEVDTATKQPQGGKMVGCLRYELKFDIENPIQIQPEKYQTLTELFQAVINHGLRWQRLSPSTMQHRMGNARLMANDPYFPIDFHNLSYHQFILYMNCLEQNGTTPHALHHRLKTMRTFLRAYGIKTSDWFYRLPPMPHHRVRKIPLPDIVKKFTTYKYSDDRYENALYQYMFTHSFTIGWRPPSEICLMTTDDVSNIEDGYIIITEQKKHYSRRQIFPEKEILTMETRKSIKNWLKWRSKVENSLSGNALYLQPSGKPFTVRHLGHKLSEHGKKIWPEFSPYDMRHWCAIARLIKTKVESKHYDKYVVKNWLGHENEGTTETYIEFAEQYYRLAPYDWIKRILKFHKNKNQICGTGKCAKIEKGPFYLGFEWKPFEKGEWARPGRELALEGNLIEKTRFERFSVFQYQIISLFSFFYNYYFLKCIGERIGKYIVEELGIREYDCRCSGPWICFYHSMNPISKFIQGRIPPIPSEIQNMGVAV